MWAAVQVGTGVTEAVPDSAENASAVEEPPRAEVNAPAIGPQPEATAAESQPGSAARPEGRKRGDRRRQRARGKMEAKPGNRQKSLFDCISYINIKFNSLT
jgi:hypothetical protein